MADKLDSGAPSCRHFGSLADSVCALIFGYDSRG